MQAVLTRTISNCRQSGRLFYISMILKSQDPVRYKLKGLKKEEYGGSYYASQLRKSPFKSVEDINWLIAPLPEGQKATTRINPVTKKKELLVRWLFYPAKYDEWVPEENIGSAAMANLVP